MAIRFSTVPSVLVCLGCGTRGWVALTGVFITVLEARGPRAGACMGGAGEGPLLGCGLPTSHCVLTRWRTERDGSCPVTLLRALSPFMRVPLS